MRKQAAGQPRRGPIRISGPGWVYNGVTIDHPPVGRPGTPERARWDAYQVVRFHNLGYLDAWEEQDCWNAYQNAARATDAAWNALTDSQVGNWHAARHRWALAEAALLEAAGKWVSAASACRSHGYPDESPDIAALYDQVTREQGVIKLTGPPDRGEDPETLLDRLTRRRHDRGQLTGLTNEPTRTR